MEVRQNPPEFDAIGAPPHFSPPSQSALLQLCARAVQGLDVFNARFWAGGDAEEDSGCASRLAVVLFPVA